MPYTEIIILIMPLSCPDSNVSRMVGTGGERVPADPDIGTLESLTAVIRTKQVSTSVRLPMD